MRLRLCVFVMCIVATLPPEVTAILPWDEFAGLAVLALYGPSDDPPKVFSVNPMINMTTGDIIQHYGYPFEKHVITTSDGYILELHRIPGKPGNRTRSHIIMVPGIILDSACFLLNGRKSPALLFHDAGHDIWLHNNRGTRYTRKHRTLSADKDKEFWNYSFHEMGVFDLPAAVDHVLNVTKSKKVFLLGHSMGGTAITIFLAEKQDYHDKVLGAFLWAPAIKLGTKYFLLVFQFLQLMTKLELMIVGNVDVIPYGNNLMLLTSHSCSGKVFSKICAIIAYFNSFSYTILVADYEKGEGTLAFYASRVSGTNVKTLHHFLQMLVNSDFRQYDYGSKTNMIKYGQTIPPEYNLEGIDVPVSVFHGQADFIVRVQDTVQASRRLKKLVSLNVISDKTFDHQDFVVSNKSISLVYTKTLNQMAVIVYDDQQLLWSSPWSTTYFAYVTLLLATMMLGMTLFSRFIRQRTKLSELQP